MRSPTFASVLLVTLLAGCAPPSSTSNKAEPSMEEAPVNVELPQMETVAAEAGVGKKGQSLEGETGMLVEPVKQLFKFEQKAVFDLQIKPALNMYKATTGSAPKTHEEFMEKIIKANNIPLPELPAGQQYVYDPEQGQLMVERPKR
jgi:hypothetical protein